jgi:hypothetical protein
MGRWDERERGWIKEWRRGRGGQRRDVVWGAQKVCPHSFSVFFRFFRGCSERESIAYGGRQEVPKIRI